MNYISAYLQNKVLKASKYLYKSLKKVALFQNNQTLVGNKQIYDDFRI